MGSATRNTSPPRIFVLDIFIALILALDFPNAWLVSRMQCRAPAFAWLDLSTCAARCTADPGPQQRILSLTVPVLQRTTPRRRGASCCAAPGTRLSDVRSNEEYHGGGQHPRTVA